MAKHAGRFPLQEYDAEKVIILISIAVCICTFLGLFLLLLGYQHPQIFSTVDNVSLTEHFEQTLYTSLNNYPEITTSHTLTDKQLIAPQPDPACYGETDSAAAMQDVLEKAGALFPAHDSLFSSDTPIKKDTTIHYYLDSTIFVVTWKQSLGDSAYTFSEVRIQHPSQFRRFFSDGHFGSGVLRTTTEMADTVNAIVASSGDYYAYRSIGVIVNDGQVYRHMGHYLDTCYIDDKGDLLFTYAGEITDQESAETFVADHNVRFSLSFGPVLIENGEYRVPVDYNSGEINSRYARAGLCQLGPLHYVLVTANMEAPNHAVPTVAEFARTLMQLGIPKAYALDGGQTAAIAMDGELINTVSYGAQREISDILYFATAIP